MTSRSLKDAERGRKAFSGFRKLYSCLDEAISHWKETLLLHACPLLTSRAGPGFSAVSHPQHSSLVTELCSTTEKTDFLPERDGKFHPFGWLERKPVASRFFAQPDTAFASCCISAFTNFPHVSIYMHSKTAASDVTMWLAIML